MRLRKLLLGSAAAVLAAGTGAVPAFAAEPIAPVGITPMATMQQYLMQCDDEDPNLSIQFYNPNLCLSLEAGAEIGFEWGYEIDYGDFPNDPDGGGPLTGGNAVVLVNPTGEWEFEWTACVTAEAEDPNNGHIFTFEFPIGFGDNYDPCDVEFSIEWPGGLTITFDEDGGDGELEFEHEFSWGGITLTFDEILVAGPPWWFNTPELVVETALGPVDLEIGTDFDFGGAPVGVGDGMMFDPWIEATAEFGDPTTLILGARTEVNDFSGTNMLDFEALAAIAHSNGFDITGGGFFEFVDIGGRVPAFGAFLAAGADVGPFEVEGGVGWARNTGFDLADDYGDVGGFRDSPYDILAVGQSQIAAFFEVGMDVGENGEIAWETTFNTIPSIPLSSTLHTGLEYTLGINMWTEFTAGVEFQTDLGNGNRATQFSVGLEVALPEI